MKNHIKKILKEEGEGIKERFLRNMKSLEYIIQSNVNNDIEEIEFVNVEFYERYKDITATIKVKSYCEDPDIYELSTQMKKVEDKIYQIIRKYEFSKNGKLNKVDGDSYLMFYAIKVNWESRSGDIFIEFYLHQDDFREIE